MINKPPGGALRLLEETDLTPVPTSMRGEETQALAKWIPTSQGYGSIFNAAGWALMRVVVQRVAEDNSLSDLYDQVMIAENLGSVVIPQLGDRFGLVQNFRLNGDRIKTVNPNYIKALNDEKRWDELVKSVGAWKWELPAGLAPADDDSATLEEIALKAAKLEAQEEGGFTIDEARVVGYINFNPTFFMHPQAVVHGQITDQGNQSPEDLEIVGGVKLFTMREIYSMMEVGDLDDGRTMSALFRANKYFY